jgi:hypothetical protein
MSDADDRENVYLISKLIAKLQEILEAEGDLPVTCWPYDGQACDSDLETVEVWDRPEVDLYNSKRPARRVVNLDA